MTLHSTKSLLFKDDDGNRFILKHLEIKTDVPEWVSKTDTFKHALEDGCLVVIDNKEKKIAAENGDLAKKAKKVTAPVE